MTVAANDRGGSRYGDRAEAIRRQRRRRAAFFPVADALFRDPAWDMLLHLFAAHERGRTESVASAIAAVEGTDATGVRWLRALADAGLIRLSDGTEDAAATVVIAPAAAAMMVRFLDATGDAPPG